MLRRQIIYACVEITIALCYAVLVLNSDATKSILCRAMPCGTHRQPDNSDANSTYQGPRSKEAPLIRRRPSRPRY